MNVDAFARERDIREVVHFTREAGLLGICFTRAVLPRSQLRKEQIIEFIFEMNAEDRKDGAWFDYVNMSINNINRRFFSSSDRWHRGFWWAILSFDPEILSHQSVYFATTNNAYPGTVQGSGPEGLQALYGPSIEHGWSWPQHRRTSNITSGDPTCPQAEVLYPGRLDTSFLRRVYVKDAASYREACSYLTFLPNHRDIVVSIEPARFAIHKVDPCRGY